MTVQTILPEGGGPAFTIKSFSHQSLDLLWFAEDPGDHKKWCPQIFCASSRGRIYTDSTATQVIFIDFPNYHPKGFFSVRASPQSNSWYRVMPISIHQSEANPSQKKNTFPKKRKSTSSKHRKTYEPTNETRVKTISTNMLKTHQLNLSRS
jgi:hypothetical protein